MLESDRKPALEGAPMNDLIFQQKLIELLNQLDVLSQEAEINMNNSETQTAHSVYFTGVMHGLEEARDRLAAIMDEEIVGQSA